MGADRDLNKLKATFKQKVQLRVKDVNENSGDTIFVTEAFRTLERQKYLYSLGRTRAWNKVTRTLNSKHRKWLAVDIAFRGWTLYPWAKARRVVADIAKKYEIDWLFDMYKRDKPHFQDNWKSLNLTKIIMENLWKYVKIMENEVPEDERVFTSYKGDDPISEKDNKALISIAAYRLKKELEKLFS